MDASAVRRKGSPRINGRIDSDPTREGVSPGCRNEIKEKGLTVVSPFSGPAAHNERAAGLSQRNRRYSNSTITSSTARLAPAVATIFFTLPSCSALRTFSIFIASMTASFSPALTS